MAKSLSAMFDELPVRGEECLGCPAGTRDALALIVPRGQWPPSIKQGFLQMVDPVHNIKKRFVSFHKWDEGLIASPIASLLHGSPLQKLWKTATFRSAARGGAQQFRCYVGSARCAAKSGAK
jgi:hypothetical protein